MYHHTLNDKKYTKHKILTKEEEAQAFDRYKNTKSIEDRDFIITHNIRFCISCASQYLSKYPYVQFEDILSYAIMGLIKAIDKYDNDNNNNKFNTYAVHWIRNSIQENIQKYESLIRMPSNHHAEMSKVFNKLKNNGSNNDDFKESEYKSKVFYSNIKGEVSIYSKSDADSNDSNDIRIIDTIVDDNSDFMQETYANELRQELIDMFNKVLTKDEINVIKLFFSWYEYGSNVSIKSIANELNMSSMRVNKLKDSALTKLKAVKTISNLR